jgi:predicted SAM-dependent methyltransferase
MNGKLKLHLGSGTNLRSGWVNVDLFEPTADLQLDLREPWPFMNSSAEIVYSEHLFEHFDFPDEAKHVLREAYRVLKPGGIFSVGVPDVPRVFAAYVRGDRDFFSTPPEWNPSYPSWLKVPMHRVNYTLRQMGEHKYAYDEETLTIALGEVGFTSIERRNFDPTMDISGREGTLWIDAAKPQTGF